MHVQPGPGRGDDGGGGGGSWRARGGWQGLPSGLGNALKLLVCRLVRVEASLLVLRADEARDKSLERQDTGKWEAVLMCDGAAHALDETHKE